MIMAFDQ